MASNLATKYAPSMTEHPYGHGFYEPELASVVRPGTCGYLNRLGQWQPIADLTNTDDLDEKKLKYPASLTRAPGRKHEWGPKCSNSVRQKKLGASVAGSGAAGGIPVEAAVTYEFWSLTSFGALLVCPNKVNQQGYYHEDPFRAWARDNAEGILKVCKDAKEYGFWVVTTTFSTDDVWINAWSSKETRVTMGFKTAVVEAGEVAPSGEFYRGDSASGWTHSEKEVGGSLFSLEYRTNR